MRERFIRAIGDEFKNRLSRKDTVPVNQYEGFQSNGAVVLREDVVLAATAVARRMAREQQNPPSFPA